MILRIVQKELLSYLLTLRFAVGGVCCVLLIASSAYVLTRQFESRQEAHRVAVTDYENRLQKVSVYSELGQAVRPEAHRPPSALSILSRGMEAELGDVVTLAHGYVPVDAVSSGMDNPYLAVFPAIDFVTVFQVVLSLLGLLFAYDAVTGEQEDGTLKLILAGGVSRSSVLLGKYTGAMLALMIPLFLSLGVGLLIITQSDYVTLTASDWACIGLILAVSLLYLSLFYLVGLLCSCAVERSASSLALCLFTWVAAVLIFPGASQFAVDRLSPVGSDRSVSDAAGEEMKQIREKALDFLKKRGVEGENDHPSGWAWKGIRRSMSINSSNDDYGSGETVKTTIRSSKDPELVLQRDFYRFQENLRAEVADRIWQIRKDYLERNHLRQARLARRLSSLSPAALYGHISAVLAGTDLDAHGRFMDQARTYRRELIQHLQDRDAFGSRTWFTSDREKADIAGIPRFRWQPESPNKRIVRASANLAILTIWNGVLFWAAYLLFVRRRVL